LALVAGISLGAAMQPQLNVGDDRPAGPQMFAAWGGERSTGPFDSGTSFAAYRGGALPDYVIGTDWKRSQTWTGERAATAEPAPRGEAAEPPREPAQVAYQEPPAEPATYPSVAGGVDYGAQAPAPAEDAGPPPVIIG
jgi:hypothetical protein